MPCVRTITSQASVTHPSSSLQQLAILNSSPTHSTIPHLVEFEVSFSGISITDPQKRLFSKKNFNVKNITYVVRIKWASVCAFVHACHVLYSGKLSREKTLRISEKYDFCGENFRRSLAFAAPKNATPQNFTENFFADNHKTAKFTEVFSPRKFSAIR